VTNKQLQAKLEEAEQQIKYLKAFKDLYDDRADGNALIISIIAQYKCESCRLFHFPEPVKKCVRVQESSPIMG
jgi:hypothetical protein